MANVKTVKTAPAADQIAPEVVDLPEVPEQADPYANLTVYTADAFVPAVHDTIRQFLVALAEQTSLVVPVKGWAAGQQSKFIRDLKAAKHVIGGRNFRVQAGTTTDGVEAIKITLSAGRKGAKPAGAE